MLPAKLDFTIYKGSTQSKPMQWKSGDPLLPVDITGCSIQMQIRESVDSTEVLDTLTTANCRITVDSAVNGQFTLHFPATVTSLMTKQYAVYDLEVVYPGSNPQYTILYGKINYVSEVTRL